MEPLENYKPINIVIYSTLLAINNIEWINNVNIVPYSSILLVKHNPISAICNLGHPLLLCELLMALDCLK